ncbi:adenosylcobalamin-dependent ribonucleoside-diphosphate reductase [Ferruginivarius sediminum]|uniref:Vitamin B12-dependent ribonucleotide reductase n=1 Tax=Ferruginivarius sediminum TaxID=2661937 RepID=A0A369T9E7_9PROT|nr:adenosylcobalamin-dependent ribonucleoside-diphosphate reductase [Ferruginivarius sediminum]RDD61908.1 adenosylcobalamin-dependent ribonucleoside-diphosphate reductase [Ferruginivarius sediminum]
MTELSAISRRIWDMKYRLHGEDGAPVEKSVEDSWARVARALAETENEDTRQQWRDVFYSAMEGFRFMPAGRIMAGAGTSRNVTLFNCFVMGEIPDDMGGIFAHLREAALTLQQGGGIGYDFSTLRPRGAYVHGVGADASGPLSFMDVWDAMCRTIMSAGSRRGAMMGTLRCDHPDIEAFIEAKHEPDRLRMFNLSVLVTDAFIRAVREDAEWPLMFGGEVFRTLRARDLWDRIMRATYDYAEPGVIFIDRVNAANNLWYCEEIHATNPCGEQPLPPYGACLLGSINLAALVKRPFEAEARLDLDALAELVPTAVRMLDNAIDCSRFPLPRQEEEARAKRRIGLGVTGLADALIMCGLTYGSREAVSATETWMHAFRRAAYLASAELAKERGPFPLYDKEKYLQGETIQALDADVREAIATHGIRNGLVTSVAPTGTISILANNVSSGLEPVYSFSYTRNVLMPDGKRRKEEVTDYAVARYRKRFGKDAELPDSFIAVEKLSPSAHVVMQAAVQGFIDSSVSKTINVPADIPFEAFKDVYMQAYDLGCKGCTTYRPNPVTGAVLETRTDGEDGETRAGPPAIGQGNVEEAQAGDVVYMTEPLERPEVLPGRTYKLRWPESDHAIYITLNDVVQDGRRRPFEIFINSKNMEHYAWTVALTRMISAVFRRGGDVSFVVEELKAVFDPRGGAWLHGRYKPSLLAAIGEVIEQHMIDIGFLPERAEVAGKSRTTEQHRRAVGEETTPPRQCPKCGAAAVIYQEGCDLCTSCGYSRCG